VEEDLEAASMRMHTVNDVNFVAFYRALYKVGVSDAKGHIQADSWWARWCHTWLHLLIVDPEDQAGHEDILT
jgi:hypothetical protein